MKNWKKFKKRWTNPQQIFRLCFDPLLLTTQSNFPYWLTPTQAVPDNKPPILKQPARTPTQLSRLAERHELPSWSTSKKNIFLSRLPYFSTMGNLREYFYESLYCKSFYDDYDKINVFRWCTTNKSRETEYVQFCLSQRASA